MIRLRVYLSSSSDGSELDLSRQLVSCSLPIDERDDKAFYSYGVISNKGKVSIRDDNENALSFYRSHFKRNLNLSISIENTVKKTSKLFLKYPIEDANYTPLNNQLDISITDNLDSWQSEEIPTIDLIKYLDYTNGGTAYDFYEKLYEYTPTNTKPRISDRDIDILKSIPISFPKMNSGTLWSCWQKLCDLSQAHIWCDGGDGEGYVVHFAINGGN